MPRWLFLDMNSFFASVEQHDHPELRGRPVGVVPVDSEYTSLIAASTEAKKAGVGMGCSVREARDLCPHIQIVKARPARYVEIHHQLKAATDKHVPIHKVYSIDEWAARLVLKEQQPDAATALAQRIKQQIRDDFSSALTCSIGIAPTRMLAKTACEMHKPDGLTVLTVDLLPDALADTPLRAIPGIGQGMRDRLERHGVRDFPALWALSYTDARRIWGSVQGEHFWLGLHGIDAPEIVTHRSSMGHAHILPGPFRNHRDAFAILIRLTCKLGSRLREQGYWAASMSVSMKYENGVRWREGRTFPHAADTPTLLRYLRELWDRGPGQHNDETHPSDSAMKPQQVSVDVHGLTSDANTPSPLFADAEQPLKLSHVLDQINRTHGSHTVYFAAMTPVKKYVMDDKIAFGRIPDTKIEM